MKKINFTTEDNQNVELFVIEQTMLGNINYILVTEADEDEEEAEVYILKETGTETEDAFYEFVEDEVELEAIGKVFAEILGDDADMVY